MLQGEHSAILSTFIKLPFAIKIFVLYIFEWPFYTGFTVHYAEESKQTNPEQTAPLVWGYFVGHDFFMAVCLSSVALAPKELTNAQF